MNTKKLLTLLLAASMLLPIAGCSSDNTDTVDTTAADTTAAVSDTETTSAIIPIGLPEEDLDGFVLTMIRSSGQGLYTEKGIYAEEQDGDPIVDEVYERNLRISEKYNCSFELTECTERYPSSIISKYVMSGDDQIDVVIDGGQFIAQYAENYIDLNSLDYFDFSQPWWNQEFNEGISLGNQLFFTIGSYMTTARHSIFHMIFNKRVATDYGIDPQSLYNHVYDDNWTLDKLIGYAQKVKSDLNGDGAYDTNDLWGMFGENYNTWTLSLGAGFRCAEKDSDDMPVISFGSESNVAILDKVMQLAGSRETTLFANRITGVSDIWKTFTEIKGSGKNWLFCASNILDSMRNMEDDYGVLPTPKFNESQDRYYHDASLGNSPTTAIPKSATNADTAAFILEAMSYDSYYNLLPIFYENYLNTKLVRDEESVEMLQIVHDSVYYDLGALYNWGNMRMIVENMADKTESDLATQFAANESKIQSAMETTLDKFNG